MSGRRRRGLSPTLFPFLAVLICTLGTLILLLALVAENATDVVAEQDAPKEGGEEAGEMMQLSAETVESMIEAEKFRVEKLVAFRDSQTADLEKRRDQLAHLEDHIRRLREQLKRISDEVESAMAETGAEDAPKTADLVMLHEQIEAERQALEELRSRSSHQTPRVVIVPHEGPNGTDRRPIYLECTADGVTIWPEGSKISNVQLQDTTPSANPLDAALRAIRYHTTHNYGDPMPPYPLLVVRPGGIESYAAARKAMQDWDDQFGYELVPAEVELAFQPADPELKPRIELAIREAVLKQETRQRIAGGSYGGGVLRGQGAAPAGRRRAMPTLSAAELDQSGRSNGYRPHSDRYGGGQYGASAGGYGPSAGDFSGDADGSGTAAARRLDEHLRAAASEFDGDDPSGSVLAKTDANPSGPANDSSSDQMSEADANGSGGPSDGPTRLQGPDNEAIQANPYSSLASDGESRDEVRGGWGSEPGQAQTPASGSPTPRDEAQPSGELDARDRKDKGEPGSDTDGRGQVDGGALATGGTGPAADRGTSGGMSAAGTQSPAAQNDSASQRDQESSSSGSPASDKQRKLVRRQGRDWALPENIAGARGNAVVRTIRVQCYRDRFVLLPSSGAGAVQVFGFSDGQVKRATLELATSVRDRVRGWGAAIPGGRWQPRLEVEVMPHGESRFHQLRTLMNGSGVEVQGSRSL